MRAFGYLRVSSDGQVDHDGFPRQRRAIEAYCQAKGLELVRVFQEEGVSGTMLERPAWLELMTQLLADGVEAVVVEKLDRLARDLMVQETIVSDLERQGKVLISTAEPDLCSSDPSRKLVRQVFGAIAEYDRATLVAKLRAARLRKRQATGRCEGRTPYFLTAKGQARKGYLTRLRNEGLSYRAIAIRLTVEQVPAPGGGPRWYTATVKRLLTSTGTKKA